MKSCVALSLRRACTGVVFVALGLSAQAQTAGTILVRHAPTVSGQAAVAGSIQVTTPENVTFSGNTAITGDMLVPGYPKIASSGQSSVGAVVDGLGSSTPTDFSIILSGHATIGRIVRRTDPIVLPAVGLPPSPSGTRDVTLSHATDTLGDPSNIRNLVIGGSVNPVAIPPGTYGTLTGSGDSTIILGVSGTVRPTTYAFQSIILSGSARIEVVGPVVVTVAKNLTANADLGSASHPDWLVFDIAGAGVSLSGNANYHGRLVAPNSVVTLGGTVQFFGELIADRVVFSGNVSAQIVTFNQPPVAAITAPAPNATIAATIPFVINVAASDPDGTVASVEVFADGIALGNAAPTGPTSFEANVANGLTAGTHLLTARATDNLGAQTTSATAAVNVIVDQPPQVSLDAPPAGVTIPATAAVMFSATASDPDGTVARVDFCDNGKVIGTATSPSTSPTTYTFVTSVPLTPGMHAFKARAYDNWGVKADSNDVTATVVAALPYTTDFESSEGYSLGSLDGQLGWHVLQGSAAVSSQDHFSGEWSVALAPSNPPAEIAQAFAEGANQNVIFVDFYAKPVADATSSATTFDVGSSRFTFVIDGTGQGNLQTLDGDGVGSGQWKATRFSVPLAANGQTQNWVRLTVRQDYTAKTWDIYANGTMLQADLHFRDATQAYLGSFSVQGHTTSVAALDYLYAATTNPLFANVSEDGIDDAWKTKYGLSVGSNIRYGDPDQDGLTNVLEYILGTNPVSADTDGDGMPDGWEVKYGLNPLDPSDATGDLVGDGISNLTKYLEGRNPRVLAVPDTTGAVGLQVYQPR